ncbi:translation initiation factor IF-2 N-terminal domain-containing protein [Rathayibacter tritici]|uniref:translation initiation factor IF-2 N-terminal domain-containing protein n=1 Tax=Rathayibacter tritici TaxID=33888 RepID=UPI000AECE684
MKIRVHELAVELGLPARRLVDHLREIGIHVKGPSSSLEDADAVTARRLVPARDAHSRWPTEPATKDRQLAEHQLFERSGYATFSEWRHAREVAQATSPSRQAAASQSVDIWEAARRSRQEADQRRWSDPLDQPSPSARRPRQSFVQGGAPGLGKRR